MSTSFFFFFFFQAEDGIRDADVTGVQTCALPISVVGRAKSPATACDIAHWSARLWPPYSHSTTSASPPIRHDAGQTRLPNSCPQTGAAAASSLDRNYRGIGR